MIQKCGTGFQANSLLRSHTETFATQATCGITPNSLQPNSLITHLDIHLKHTWELAWLLEGNLQFKK